MSSTDGAGAATLEMAETGSPHAAAPAYARLGRAVPAGLVGQARVALRAMRALLWMSVIEQRRYAFNAVMRLIAVYAFFFMLFMGARVTLGSTAGYGDSLASLVVVMLVFMMAQRAYQDHSTRLNAEAMQGTLEQLAMSRVGLSQVLVYNLLVMTVVQLGFNAVFVVMMMATTGQWLHLDVLSIVPLLLVSILAVHGLGLAMGGLTLLFKRVGATAAIFQYVFLMLVAVPVDRVPLFRYLPLSYGSGLIRRVMVDGESLFRMPAGDVLFLAVNSGAYFAAGLLVFHLCERAARTRGMLGHY
jgi:ABC-2 type transport system permease protein